MANMTLKMKYLIFLTPLLFFACRDSKTNNRNRWIKTTMEDYYLWEAYLPSGINPNSYDDSFDFFEQLRYKEDYWSWLSNDYYETSNMLDGITTTGGYEFYLTYIDSLNYSIAGVIEYVLPESPAALSHIKRGDIFTRINGSPLNTDNYYQLLSSYQTYTLGFDSLSQGTFFPIKEIEITEVENFQEHPILIDTVFNINGKKIAYLMYNSFIEKFNPDLDLAFSAFNSQGVEDIIVDLRYNLGGDVSAEKHLANLIAPPSTEGEIFSKDHWNDLLTDYFMEKRGEDFFISYIESSSYNLNLEGKMIGLTSGSTASASEGLLNGLEPLLDLTLIGDTTHGKYTGMVVLPDDEDQPQWALIPIVVKTTNKNDVSVKGGMAPNYTLSDKPLDGYQLGDIRETMLARAIEEITGLAIPKSTRLQPDFISQPIARFKHGKKLEAMPRIIGRGNVMMTSD